MYIAHTNQSGDEQSVKQHLEGVEKLCKEWAIPPTKELAALAGILHDIGKYSEKFQERIHGNHHIQVEHAVCGAKEAEVLLGIQAPYLQLLQYVIAGHHTGLPDGGAENDREDQPTLYGRLSHKTEDFSAYKKEITISCPSNEAIDCIAKGCTDRSDKLEMCERYAFLTKYIFSCLTDADFLDTEKFCQPKIKRGMGGDFEKALEKINAKLESFVADTPVKQARADLQKQAECNFSDEADISFLPMPTGSGKTLCSLKLALEYAVRKEKKHIVYIIPYTSIIEQTADIFSNVLGESIEILEHHSNYDFDDSDKECSTTSEKLKKACENWDAKLIVTTNAQFFQSLYHYKGSRLRKLHNLADAVLVFDEIHMLPVNHLQPCLRGIGYITKYLNSHAIFLSATMPDLMPLLQKYAPMVDIHELITEKDKFSSFKNCHYNFIGDSSFEQIAMLAQQQENSLCVVNSRKGARELFRGISGKKFHLSTFMTPVDRLDTLAKIRECLERNEHITVVSTSLIEAGVDLDFSTVFRQLAGLDSILQSGGRCNREGRRENAEVIIFETDEKPKGDLGIRAEIARSLLKENDDINTPECVAEYYRRLFAYSSDIIERNSIARFNEGHFDAQHFIKDIPFRSYAEYFEYIQSESIAVIIATTAEIRNEVQRAMYNPSIKRKLQRYAVSVYSDMLRDLLKRGIVQEQSGMFVLESDQYYDKETGLIDQISDAAFIN